MSKKRKQPWDEWERQAWAPPPEETIDEWAERSLVLPRGVSSVAGPLSLELTPYLREPLRAVRDPEVEEIVLCTSSQVGKTTFLIVSVLYYMANDPWNVFHIMPSEDEALEVKRERYLPIIRESPALSRFIEQGGRGQFSGDTITLNGCTVTFRGSHSASGLASKPGRVAIGDELDKWERWTGQEADPVDLLGERLKTFHDSKYLKCSTPTTQDGRIYCELESSSNERYFVPCPLCSEAQVLVFGDGTPGEPGIKWPKDASAEEIEYGDLAWYECAHCGGRIDEGSKRQMVMAGTWHPLDEASAARGRRKRGFHIWAAYSLWPKAGWSKIAARFLRSKDASSSLMNFRNSWLAETWRVALHELKTEEVRAVSDPYPMGQPPVGPWIATCGVDVQEAGGVVYQYFVIRGWGESGKSWLIRCGRTPGWQGLYQAIFESVYRDQAGSHIPVQAVFVDSGYKTDEVYQFCDLYGLWAAKGDARSKRPYTLTETESSRGSGRYIRRVNVNPDYYKSQIHHHIRDGKWRVPECVPPEYYEQIVSEQLTTEVEKRTGRARHRWKVITPGAPNHYLDAEVLAHAGADVLEMQYRTAPPPKQEAAPRPQVRRIQSRIFS